MILPQVMHMYPFSTWTKPSSSPNELKTSNYFQEFKKSDLLFLLINRHCKHWSSIGNNEFQNSSWLKRSSGNIVGEVDPDGCGSETDCCCCWAGKLGTLTTFFISLPDIPWTDL